MEPFFFGIPLIAPAAANDWSTVDRLFNGTLRSLLAQSDADFEILIAGHEPPPSLDDVRDRRIQFLEANWTAEPPSSANDDSGAKKSLIKQVVLGCGGGLLMFVDGDDLVDIETVAAVRGAIRPFDRGGIVGHGFAIDFSSGRAVPLPHPRLDKLRFHQVCGSSTIGRLRPGEADPFLDLGWHRDWPVSASRRGESVALLPLTGGYLVNTGESHSETHGPFAGWKREFARKVRQFGTHLPASERQRLSFCYEDAEAEAA